MSNTTFEVAKRCPKCDMPGDDTSQSEQRNSRGQQVTIHMIFCRNTECRWYNTSWIVQVNPDGTIPEAYSQLGNKKFPKLSAEAETRVQESLKAQLAQETQPGGAELRNPRS